jgi:hypothetical protein
MWLFADAATILEALRATEPEAAEDRAAQVGRLAEWEGVPLPLSHALQLPA